MNEIAVKQIWDEYAKGMSYNETIGLPDTVKQNENMFIGRQWEGFEAETLQPVVLNFIKPTVHVKCAYLLSEDIQITARPEGVEGSLESEQDAQASLINAELARLWEKETLTAKTRRLLRDAAVTGDGCWHVSYQMGEDREDAVTGGISVERVDNLNVLFGNPADARVDEQPHILLVAREYVDKVRRRAPEGLDVKPNNDAWFDDADTGAKLVTVITRYWKDLDTGRVWMSEAVENGFLREPVDTGLTRYPVVFMNWEAVRGSYHGEAAVSEMVPSQIAVNQIATMRKVSITRTAFPTVIYRDDVLPNGWDNSVGAAMGVGTAVGIPPGTPLQDVAYMLDGARHNPQADSFMAELLNLTKGLNGATDAALGDVKPDNTSAIIAAQKAATTPLELVRQAMYQFMEDFARVCIEMIGQYYGPRYVAVTDEVMGEMIIPFDFSQVKPNAYQIKIDVGGSSYWSEFTEVATLDNLFNKQLIDPATYIEFLPQGVFSHKQKLMQRLREQAQMMAAMQQAQAGGMVAPPGMPGQSVNDLQQPPITQ